MPPMKFLNKKILLITLMVCFVGLEIGVRLFGLTDFPLSYADNVIGYIPKPSQSGAFLGKNYWKFNSLSMQNDREFNPTSALDILLIGDSVVSGGNPFKKEARLGVQLSKMLNQQVWSISAGSWGIRNELAYIKIHQDVVNGVGSIIFISNSGDFDKASSWACEYTHPRVYPLIASFYLFKRYVYWPGGACNGAATPEELLVPEGDWKADFKNEISKPQYKNKQILFFMYPDRSELHENRLGTLEGNGKEVLRLSKFSTIVYSVGRDSRWNERLYKDDIHPSVEGMEVLARIISSPEKNTQLKIK